MFARTPRTIEAALLALANDLEKHARQIRQLIATPASKAQTAATVPSPAADPLDALVIDPRHLEETEAEFARLDRERHG